VTTSRCGNSRADGGNFTLPTQQDEHAIPNEDSAMVRWHVSGTYLSWKAGSPGRRGCLCFVCGGGGGGGGGGLDAGEQPICAQPVQTKPPPQEGAGGGGGGGALI
jgi:hypothetical protein